MQFDQAKRRDFITLFGGAAALSLLRPLAANAQQSKAPRIGALVLTDQDGRAFGKALREGLRELGLIEGENYALELRSADAKADRLPQLAQELVRLKVDVIAAIFTPCALAAKQATREIPIFVIAGDPIGTGLVASLARPGGNITGLSNMGSEAAGKCVELFRDMLPSLSRVAVLANPVDPFTRSILEQVQLAGRTTGIEIAPVAMVRALDEVEAAFAAIAKERAGAVVVQPAFSFKMRSPIWRSNTDYHPLRCCGPSWTPGGYCHMAPTYRTCIGAARYLCPRYCKAPSLRTCPSSSPQNSSW